MPERKVRTKQTRLSLLDWVPVLVGTRLDVAITCDGQTYTYSFGTRLDVETSMCMSDHHKLFPCKILDKDTL
jgi:hypothetical protein